MHSGGDETYSDLHNVGTDEVKALQSSDDGPQLARRPTARLRGSGGGGN